MAPVDVIFAAIAAPLDDRLSLNDRDVMAAIARWPARDLTDVVREGDITLDALCRRVSLPRPYVFYCVARLEDLGYLPIGGIR